MQSKKENIFHNISASLLFAFVKNSIYLCHKYYLCIGFHCKIYFWS
jgi:hypothetical protein